MLPEPPVRPARLRAQRLQAYSTDGPVLPVVGRTPNYLAAPPDLRDRGGLAEGSAGSTPEPRLCVAYVLMQLLRTEGLNLLNRRLRPNP
jgi:hypothetical protein